MQPVPPSEAELAALLAKHADRFPEKYTITVRGDHGAAVALPFLLMNPGADSVAWADFMRACLGVMATPGDLAERMAADSIAWPPPKEWAAWLDRWPSLAVKVSDAIMLKVGAKNDALTNPSPKEQPPGLLSSILDAHPRAVWVKVSPPGDAKYAFAVEAPAPASWRIFKKSIAATGADVVKLARALADACVIGCALSADGEHVPVSAGTVFDRWIGIVGHVVSEVTSLTGSSADVSLGGW